ncbi:MAG: hypothetical protein QG670_1314 [Thermoproteota archaeon]|nr:hypothetical protein [Thermoproteota archaeon]
MWILIALNVLVFYWEFTEGFNDNIFLVYGETPALIMQGEQLSSVLTSMFIHVDIWHIFGNMLFLFIFGDNVEDRFGHVKFLILYLIFGVVGGLTHSAIAVMLGGIDQYIPAVGASGAIAGVLGAYLIFFPNARIVSIIPSFVFVRLARVPAFIFIGFWFILQILYSGGSTSVAYMAHVGGFMAGFVVAVMFKASQR